ncbi:MAG: hypothetical protein RSB71_04435 [Bacilli bacterium]
MNENKRELSHTVTHYGPEKGRKIVTHYGSNNNQNVQPLNNQNVQPLNTNPTPNQPKVKKKKIFLIPLLILMLLVIGASVYFTFFNKKPVVLKGKLDILPLTLKGEKDIITTNIDQTKHTGKRKLINNFGIDIPFELVDAGYNFEIVNNIAKIKTKDNNFEFSLVQLSDKPYGLSLPKELENEYTTLVKKLTKDDTYKNDINSAPEMIEFYKKNKINSKINFETLTNSEKISFINKSLGISITKFTNDGSFCNFGDCMNILYTGTNELLASYTKAENSTVKKNYYGTYLIYQKNQDVTYNITFSNDIAINN